MRHLAVALEVKHAFITECTDSSKTRVRSLAFWSQGKFNENFEYDLEGTPCQEVLIDGKICFHSKGVQTRFPMDTDLVELGAESYLGIPINDSSGTTIGHLAVLDNKPMNDNDHNISILKIFATRAGAELERKDGEEALRLKEKQYQDIFETVIDGLFICNMKGTVVEVNHAACRMYGYDYEELIGINATQLVHPDERCVFQESLQNFKPGEPFHTETIDVRKDGTPFPVEVYAVDMMFRGSPHLLAIVRDISERKKAEEELREMSLALTYAMPGIARLDQDGKYISVNEIYANIIGYEPDELVSTDCLQTVHPDDLQIVDEAFQKMLKKGSANFEVLGLRKDGSIFNKELLVVKRIDKEGTFIGHNCFMRDITERKQSENEIARLQQFYGCILDGLPIQMAVFDVTGHYQYLNPAAVSDPEMREWLIGKTDFDYCRKRKIPEKIAQDRWDALNTCIREKQIVTIDEEFPSRQNGLRHIVRSCSPIVDANGEVTDVIGYSMDITEKKMAEHELQKAHDELENRVKDRTAELTNANNELKREIKERKHAEEELKNSEERLKILFEYAPDGYYLHDLAGNFVSGNRAAEKLSGYAREELIGKSFLKLNLISPQQIPKAVANLIKNALGKPTGPDEFILTRKDGSKIPVETRTFPMKIKNQTLVLGSARDITERKRAEKALRESKERYHNIFETAAVSIWEEDYSKLKFTLDDLKKKGVKNLSKYLDEHPEFLKEAVKMIEVLDVNDTTLKMYGAKSKSQLLGSLDKILSSESSQSFKEQLVAIAENKSYFETETINITMQGKPIDILLRINLPSKAEKFSNLLISIMDITERKQAEKALMQSEERFSKAFHATPIAISISHIEDARFIDINNRFLELSGYESEELIGHSALDLGIWCNPEARIKMRNEITETGSVRNFETKIRAKNGEVREIRAGVELIELDGKTCILSMIEDVTERNRAQEAKERLRQKIIRSAAIVEAQENERRRISRELHDGIGQILTAVKFNFETLEETLKTETNEQSNIFCEIKEQLSNAVSEGERISYNLMPRILDDFGIVPTLERLCKQVSQHSHTKVKFYSHNPKGRLKSNIEMGLYRIAQEALNNVAKHSNAKEATVQIVHHPAFVNLIVEDDGKGFQPNESERKGHGMGLMNMRERTEALNGTLTIDSKRDFGTEIIVEIPLK